MRWQRAVALVSAAAPLCAYAASPSVSWLPIGGEGLASKSAAAVGGEAIAGVHNGALMIIGGVTSRSDPSVGLYSRKVWIGTLSSDGASRVKKPGAASIAWRMSAVRLPTSCNFAMAASHELGVIALGGRDGSRACQGAVLLRWSPEQGAAYGFALPPLPEGLVEGSAAAVGYKLYVLGRNDAGTILFYTLDLSPIAEHGRGYPAHIGGTARLDGVSPAMGVADQAGSWRALETAGIAGAYRHADSQILLVSQYDGRAENLYAATGIRRASTAAAMEPLLMWRFVPGHGWRQGGRISVVGGRAALQHGVAAPLGQSHIMLLASRGSAPASRGGAGGNRLPQEAPVPVALSYSTITESWAMYAVERAHGILPGIHDSSAVSWRGNIIVLSTRNPSAVWVVDISASHAHLDRVGLGIMVIYLVAVVVLGVFFAARIRDINDYFRGGQRIPWWAAGCSMYATLLSSLTYVALPAVVYRTDWVLYLGICTVLIVTPFVIRVVLPFFRGIDATSAYEYLSMRFNLPVRLLASGLFTAFHIGRMGVVMALTGLALAAVTPLDAWQSVIIMGLLCLVYSAAGGVEGVIWTDTMQVVVLVAGAIGCLVFMIASLDGGLLRYAALGAADGKFTLINPDFSGGSLTTFALWVVVLGGIGQNISSYTADQAVVQRYMTTPDIKSSARSIWVNAIMASLGSLLFFAVGTGLYVFYKTRPGDLDPTVQLDQIFPHFIVSELPNGLAGLAIAGIFAAAQSTISTSINSVSAALVTDFLRPFKACGTERGYFSTARWLTVAVGALGTLAGLLFINDRIRSLLEEYFVVIGISMGALGGLFALGMLTNRANSWGAVIGLLASVSVLVILWVNQSAEGYLFAAIGVCVCVVVGYIASMVFPRTSAADIDGLTIHTSRGAGYGTKLVGRD